jgi:hypothetical protein
MKVLLLNYQVTMKTAELERELLERTRKRKIKEMPKKKHNLVILKLTN